jgi:hypothetical protein
MFVARLGTALTDWPRYLSGSKQGEETQAAIVMVGDEQLLLWAPLTYISLCCNFSALQC